MKLTKSKIDKLSYKGNGVSRYVAWDDDLKGFGCRVYPSGRKSFIVSYRFRGKKRLMTIGDFGIYTIQNARTEAQEALLNVRKGLDPIAVKDKSGVTYKLKDLCHEFIEKHSKVHKKTWDEDERRLNRSVLNSKHSKYGNRSIDEISINDMITLHESIGKTAPIEANRTITLIATIFEYAKKMGYLPHESINPARGIDKFKEHKRDRWIKHDEIPKLFKALEKEENVFIKAAVWLFLLTGVRKSELLKAKWADVDFNRSELRLPDTKANRVHYVPLSKPAIEILQSIPKVQSNPYIIQGRKQGSHLVNISKAWNRIRTEAGLTDVRLHDLRRTVGSWLATSGKSLPLIGKVLNHSNPSTTQIYSRLSQDPAKIALEEHGENIISFAKMIDIDLIKKAL